MKNYLIIVCAAVAMIGCAHDRDRDRGGVGENSERQTGYDRNYKMPKSDSSNGSSVTNSSSVTNNTESGSTSDRSSGAGSQDNQSPTPSPTTTPQN